MTRSCEGAEIVRFRPEEEFRDAAVRVLAALMTTIRSLAPSAVVEHVGSTAVPGSLTKGDVDVQVRVSPEQFAATDVALASRFERNTDNEKTPDFSSFKDESMELPVGVQLTAIGGTVDEFWAQREVLLGRADLRAAYDELKRRFDGAAMDEYRRHKAAFFERLRGEPEFNVLLRRGRPCGPPAPSA